MQSTNQSKPIASLEPQPTCPSILCMTHHSTLYLSCLSQDPWSSLTHSRGKNPWTWNCLTNSLFRCLNRYLEKLSSRLPDSCARYGPITLQNSCSKSSTSAPEKRISGLQAGYATSPATPLCQETRVWCHFSLAKPLEEEVLLHASR